MLKPTFKYTGTTATEKYLSHLCEQCFFGLWSYPNIYTDEGNKGGRTTGKELCDLLVVFGNDVIIFSDKMIAYKTTEDAKVGWSRWVKRAIQRSASQIYKAERWIKEHPTRIYHDKFCKNKFVIPIPDAQEMRIHRVVITSNMGKTCSEFYGGGSSGTFILTPALEGDQHYLWPFHIGNVDSKRGYVHVFNEVSISVVLSELDTAGDFIEYLKKREAFMLSGRVSSIAGEEELVGYYLKNHFDYDEAISDMVSQIKELSEYSLTLMEGDWSQHLYSDEYIKIKEARRHSYAWDLLIRNFDEAILAGNVPEWTDRHIHSHELALRMVARERRAFRQILGRNLLEKRSAVKSNERSARVLPSSYGDTCYVILVFGLESSENLENYRQERFACLHAYCYVVKLKNPKIRYVVGIATEQMIAPWHSEELIVFDFEGWDEADNKIARKLQEEYSILKNIKQEHSNEELVHEMFPWLVSQSQPRKTKIGRNERCPCGSGKKYKKCCGF